MTHLPDDALLVDVEPCAAAAVVLKHEAQEPLIGPVAKIVFVSAKHLGEGYLTLDGVDVDLGIKYLGHELIQSVIQVILRRETVGVLHYVGEVRAHEVDSPVIQVSHKLRLGISVAERPVDI
jgi:hypothetical protein